MCLPAAALPIMAIASSVVSAGGAVMGGLQARAQGRADADVAKQNAALEVEGARESVLAGGDERRDFWRKVGQIKGQQVAAMSANGIEIDSGTAAMMREDTQFLANEDAKNLYGNIEKRTRGHLINASNFATEAKAARQRGNAAFTQSLFSAASSLIGGASQAAGLRAKMPTSGGSSAANGINVNMAALNRRGSSVFGG
jgi:hypothetical protein